MFLTTKDGVKIIYNWRPAANPAGYLVLVHMMPATKDSWQDFADWAKEKGYASMAIDLRGHGQSDGGPNGYQNFSDAGHQKSILDLQAAVDFLKTQGADAGKIAFIGASIGANLSLWYLADHPEVKSAALLSPGLDYRGIKTEPLVKRLKDGQKVMFVTGRDDDDNPAMSQRLYDLVPAEVQKEIIIYEKGGHGTNLFSAPKGPDLKALILDFLKP